LEEKVTPSAVSQLLGKLEKVGYTKRTINPQNRRGIFVELEMIPPGQTHQMAITFPHHTAGRLFPFIIGEEVKKKFFNNPKPA
jgi:hypothetical protein